jgi:hypothetical protein
MKKPLLFILTFLFLYCSDIQSQYNVNSDYILNPDLIKVVGLTGKVKPEEQIHGNSSYNNDLSSLYSDFYFVVLQQNSGSKTIKKVIKQ